MNPEFLAMSNLKNSDIYNLEPLYLWKVIKSKKYAGSYGQDIKCNTNVNCIEFV